MASRTVESAAHENRRWMLHTKGRHENLGAYGEAAKGTYWSMFMATGRERVTEITQLS